MTTVRPATAADASACADIYGPYVRDSVVTFELEPPDADEMRRRIAHSFAWLVAEDQAEIVEYAYAGPYLDRPAYRWAATVSVYLRGSCRGRGVGTLLYRELFGELAARGFRTLLAGVTLPNPASVALHKSFGFEQVGIWRRIGWKQDAWHDVWWAQTFVGDGVDPPSEPDRSLLDDR